MENKEKFTGWKKRNKMSIQVIALILAIVSPFLLYFALNNDFIFLSGVFFGGIALAMVLVAALT